MPIGAAFSTIGRVWGSPPTDPLSVYGSALKHYWPDGYATTFGGAGGLFPDIGSTPQPLSAPADFDLTPESEVYNGHRHPFFRDDFDDELATAGSVSTLDNLSSFTIFFCLLAEPANVGANAHILHQAGSFDVFIDSATGKLGLKTQAGTPVLSTASVCDSVWRHVFISVNALEARLYINGVLNATLTLADTPIPDVDTWFLGAGLYGELMGVGVATRASSVGEVGIVNDYFQPWIADLVAPTTFSQIFGSGDSFRWGHQYSRPTADTALWVNEGAASGWDAHEFSPPAADKNPLVGDFDGNPFPWFFGSLFSGQVDGLTTDDEFDGIDGESDVTFYGSFSSLKYGDGGDEFQILTQISNFEIYGRFSFTDFRIHMAASIDNGEQWNDDTPASRIDDGAVHHWALVFTNGVGRLFLDGVQLGPAVGGLPPFSFNLNALRFGKTFSEAHSGGIYLGGIATRAVGRHEVGSLFDIIDDYVGTETAPNVTGVTPSTAGDGDPVSVDGTGFESGALVFMRDPAVLLSWTPADNVAFVDPTEITCDVPAGFAEGAELDVMVVNPSALHNVEVAALTVEDIPPTNFYEFFEADFAHFWDIYEKDTPALEYTDSVGGFDLTDTFGGAVGPPPEGTQNSHIYPVFDGGFTTRGLTKTGVNFTTLDGAANWTIWFAFKTNAGQAYGAIIDKGSAFYVELAFGTGSLYITIGAGGGADIPCTIPLDDDQWHRCIVTCVAGTVTVYIDGVADGTDTGGTVPTVTNDLLIGVQPSNTVTDSGILFVGVALRGISAPDAGVLDSLIDDYVGVTGPAVVSAELVGVEGDGMSLVAGSAFTGTTDVEVDGTPCEFVELSDTQLLVRTPPKPAGLKNVVVTTSAGPGTGTNILQYHDPADSDMMLYLGRASFFGDTWDDRGASGASWSHSTLFPAETNREPRFNEGATNHQLANTALTWPALISADRLNYTVTVKLRVRSLPANNATSYLNAGVIVDGAAYAGLFLSDTRVIWRHHDGSENTAVINTPLSLDEDHVIDIECNAGSLRMRVDGGTWSTPVVVSPLDAGSSSFTLKMGQNHDNTKPFIGDVSSVQVSRIPRGDTWLDENLDWLRSANGFRRAAGVPEMDIYDDAFHPWALDVAQFKGRGLLALTDARVGVTATPNVVEAMAAVPSCDGSNDRLVLGGTMDTYYNAAAYSGYAAFIPKNIVGAAGPVYANDILVGTQTSAWWVVSIKSDDTASIYHLNSLGAEIVITIPGVVRNRLNVLRWRYDGTDLFFSLNGGGWRSTSTSGLNSGGMGEALSLASGVSAVPGLNFNGLVVEAGLSDTDLGATALDNTLAGLAYDHCAAIAGVTPAAFDRSTLSLTAYLKPGEYTSGNWNGATSAGTSASNDATEATNPPAVYSHASKRFGTVPASPDFNGIIGGNHLDLPGDLDTHYNGGSYSGWALVRPTKLTANNVTAGQAYANHGILSTQISAYWCLCVRANGEAVIRHYNLTGTPLEPAAGYVANGVFSLIQWNYDGTTLKLRVNGGPWTSIAATGLGGGLTEVFQIGKSIDGQPTFPGIIPEVGLKDAGLTDVQHDAILASINYDFGLSLGGYAAIEFDRSTVSPVTLYQAGDYALGTWTATVGSNATEATSPPRVSSGEYGTARMPAKTANVVTSSLSHPRHDGVDDYQQCSDADIRNLVSNSAATGGSIGIVFFAYTGGAPTANNARYTEQCLLADANGNISVSYSEGTGSSPAGITFSAYNGSVFEGVNLPCTPGELHYVQVRWNATHREIRLDGGPWKRLTHVVSNLAAGNVFLGKSFTTAYSNSEVFDLMTEQAPWTDDDANDLIAYANETYGARFANARTAGYDPAVRTLTIWQKAGNYSAGSWPGTASAGSSGTRSFSQGTGSLQPAVASTATVTTPYPLTLINSSGIASQASAFEFDDVLSIIDKVATYRTDVGLTLDANGKASAMNDQSGAGDANRHFGQATAAARPTPVSNPMLGGRQVLRFDGSDDYLVNPAAFAGAPRAQPMTYYVVCLANELSGNFIFDVGVSVFTNRNVFYQNGTFWGMHAGSDITSSPSEVVVGRPIIAALVFNTTASSIYVDKYHSKAGSGNVGTQAFDSFTLGARYALDPTLFWVGDIAVLAAKTGFDSTKNRRRTMKALATYYQQQRVAA